MKVKVAEAEGTILNWMVAKAERKNITIMHNDDGSLFPQPIWVDGLWQQNYSSNWGQGGPLIEREGIASAKLSNGQWRAWYSQGYIDNMGGFLSGSMHMTGPTPLVAAMRCFVASKLGEEVDIPEELL